MPGRPTYTGTNQLQSCPDGLGLKLDNSAQCLGFDGNSVTSSLANGWSLEALVRITNYAQIGPILGWNQNVDGTGGADRFLAVNFASGPDFRSLLYDGANKVVEGFNFSAGQRCHVVATASSSLFSLYVNGALITTTGLSNAGLNNYRYLCVGANFSADFGNGTLVLANFANVAWTATEVQARYLNPYGFLAWPEDRRHYLVGVVGTGAQNLAPSLFTNTNTFFNPTVGRGAVNLAPSLFTNTSTFFAPTVSSVANLTPSLFTNSNTFFSPTVVTAGNLAPSLFTNSSTFFSPTVGRGVVNLAPTLFANSNIFYSPTVAVAQPQALLPSLYTNPNTFFLPVVHSHIVLVNVYVKLLAPHVFSAQEYPTDTVFGPDQSTIPPDFQYTPLMEGLSGDSISAIAQTNIDVFGRYDAHGNLLDNPPIPRPIYDPQPTPAVGDKHFLPLGNGSWP
jgi:hypothetical protein